MSDDWVGPNGERLVPHADAWRLVAAPASSRMPGHGHRPIFEGAREECLRFAAFVVEHERSVARFVAAGFDRTVPFGDYDIRIHKTAGQPLAQVGARLRATGGIAGGFGFQHSRLEGCYVCDELVIDGSPHVADAHQRRGLATAMRDAAEQLSGLRSVPHGHALIGGVQTPAAKAFWVSRRRTHDVPAFEGPEAFRRKVYVKDRQANCLREARHFLRSAFAVQLAERLGGTAMVCEFPNGARLAWCELDGQIATSAGFIGMDDLQRHARERFGPDAEVLPRTATPEEVAAFMEPPAFFPHQLPGASAVVLDAICERYYREMAPAPVL